MTFVMSAGEFSEISGLSSLNTTRIKMSLAHASSAHGSFLENISQTTTPKL